MNIPKYRQLQVEKKIIGAAFLIMLVPLLGIIVTDAALVWPLSTIIYNLGLFYLFVAIPGRLAKTIAYNVLAFAFFVVEACFFFSYYLQNAGFNDAFFYHVRLDLLYGGVNEHLPIFALMIACLFGFLAIFSVSLIKQPPIRTRFFPLALAFVVVGLFISPPARGLALYALNWYSPNSDNALFDQFPELLDPQVTAEFIKTKKPNIVLIYAESLEQRFFDEDVFPRLVPNLKKLKEGSIVFSNVSEGVNANWTIAALVASQCGYPLTVKHEIGGNGYMMFDEFLPKATCLGDILAGDGYQVTFIGGADERFSGKDKYLSEHGYSEVIGRDTLLGTLIDKSYRHFWGAYDDTMFDFSINKFKKLSSTEEPFFLALLTVDTHHPDGFLSKTCGTYGQGDNSILNAVHCTDKLIDKFVEQIRRSSYSENTIIIVLSDHLAMRNQASSLLEKVLSPERLTFLVNMPNGQKGIIANPGLTYDIAPTILDIAGYQVTGQIGFGTPLTRGEGYLVRKFGEIKWKEQSAKLKEIGNILWDDNVVLDQDGIRFTLPNLVLAMGGKTFDLHAYDHLSGTLSKGLTPAIILFNEKSLELEKIMYFKLNEDYVPGTLAKNLLEYKEKITFVIAPANELPGHYGSGASPYYFFGKPGGMTFLSGPIAGDIAIPFDVISDLSRSRVDEKLIQTRRISLKHTLEMSSVKQ